MQSLYRSKSTGEIHDKVTLFRLKYLSPSFIICCSFLSLWLYKPSSTVSPWHRNHPAPQQLLCSLTGLSCAPQCSEAVPVTPRPSPSSTQGAFLGSGMHLSFSPTGGHNGISAPRTTHAQSSLRTHLGNQYFLYGKLQIKMQQQQRQFLRRMNTVLLLLLCPPRFPPPPQLQLCCLQPGTIFWTDWNFVINF